jgi:nucleotide-binding universal stress UspA family protein
MRRRLLVPLDGSKRGERVLPWAISLARSKSLTIVLTEVVPWPVFAVDNGMGGAMLADTYEEIEADEREGAQEYLDDVRRRLADRGVFSEIAVREGPTIERLLEIAATDGTYAIVMATHGRDGLSRIVFGSTAESVAQQSSVPVLLLKVGADDEPPPPSFGRILVPLDGSAFAERALDLAREIATPAATLILVRVIEPGEAAAIDSADETRPHAEPLDDTFETASVYLRRLGHELLERGESGRDICTDLRIGNDWEEIVAAAQDHAADLIVMSSHGHTGPTDWLLGGVADKVIRHAEHPVFLVTARTVVARPSVA